MLDFRVFEIVKSLTEPTKGDAYYKSVGAIKKEVPLIMTTNGGTIVVAMMFEKMVKCEKITKLVEDRRQGIFWNFYFFFSFTR